jgi:hypothetical protein
MSNEEPSLTAPLRESEPSVDERPGPSRLVEFRQDEEGYWVAVMSCGHTQHLRHQPPWQNRAWVLDPERRRQMLGRPYPCGWCLKAEETADRRRSAPKQQPKED